MILRIQKDRPSERDTIEASLFTDISGNTWKLTVTKHNIYIEYLGSGMYRLDRVVLKSDTGREIAVTHDNLFCIEGSEFEDYYELREVLMSDATEHIWKYIQWRIYNSPVGVFT